MENISRSKAKTLTLISLICFIIPSSIYGLWIYVFNLGTTHAERVSIFKEYFPDFLDGRWSTTIISIVFSISAVILSATIIKYLKGIWKGTNILILTLSSVLLFLNLFSML